MALEGPMTVAISGQEYVVAEFTDLLARHQRMPDVQEPPSPYGPQLIHRFHLSEDGSYSGDRDRTELELRFLAAPCERTEEYMETSSGGTMRRCAGPEYLDVSEYFVILDRLHMEEGYGLDYVHWQDFRAGRPHLFALPRRHHPEVPILLSRDDLPFPEYLRYVHTDGTAAGFYQLAVLWLLGEHFYQIWHAHSNDEIVFDEEVLESILDMLDMLAIYGGSAVGPEERRRALQIDLTPTATFIDEGVCVRLVCFSKWVGFYEWEWTVRRPFPHLPLQSDGKMLVPYNCGIRL